MGAAEPAIVACLGCARPEGRFEHSAQCERIQAMRVLRRVTFQEIEAWATSIVEWDGPPPPPEAFLGVCLKCRCPALEIGHCECCDYWTDPEGTET